MEIAVSVGTSLADRTAIAMVDGTWQQIRYVLDYHDNMANLRDKLRDLQNSKARVDHKVDEARTGLEEIEGDVLAWISDAYEAILRVNSILEEDGVANKTCCAGRLPNFKNRYKLSKRAKLEAPAISELADKGAKFGRVGYRVPLHHQVLPSVDYEAFGSRESTLNSIMEVLRNRDADLIGVWGLGGVGKTTLAKEVGQRMKAEGVFQLVVTVEVHPEVDVKTIQERVAEWVEIKKEVKSLDSAELRAALLHKRLLQEKSILLILDDVWNVIDLKEVGIRIGGDTNRCTVLVTTRDQDVVSQMADTAEQKQKLFQLNGLGDREAWELFQKKVGLVPEDDHVRHNVATQIVKRCGGLPILILPVASALKNKEFHVWEDALLRLQSGPGNDDDHMQAEAYFALELSRSHLTEEQNSLFLFCGLLDPHFIPSDYLLQCTISLGLLKDCPTIKAARSRVLTLLGKLKSSCLLLQGTNQKHFTMHDVVHNFARRKCKDHVFAPAARSVVDKWPDRHVLKQLTCISLPYCRTGLPTRLECPKLEVFLLYGGQQDQPLSTPDHDRFFEAVGELKVLDFSDVHLSSLPSSLQCLQNLGTLCLDRCIVEDISVIESMTRLKILSLTGAGIVHLPKEIGQLCFLQQLDLSECINLQKISPGILSCLTNLEELYMRATFTQWGLRDKTDGQQINADLTELKKLKKLTALEIGVSDVMSLTDGLFSDKLERFFIVIGDCWNWSRNDDVSATLKVKLDARIRVLKKVNVLLKKADDLHLDNSVGVKDADLLELNMEGFGNRLINLQLQNFHAVQYLVNSVERGPRIAFPRLEVLVIDNAQHLEKICNGPLKEESLGNLKQIKISNCHAMSNVLPLSVARYLSKLENIKVAFCEKMEGIFIIDDDTTDKDEKVYLSRLRKLTLDHLPCLNSILSSMTSQETTEDAFFNKKVLFPSLEEMRVSNMDRLRMLWINFLERFPNLEKLIVSLSDFVGLFTYEIPDEEKETMTLSRIQHLNLQFLPKLEHIWNPQSKLDRILNNLQSLIVGWCDCMIHLAPPSASLRNLTTLQVWHCKSLVSLFTFSTMTSLVQLREMTVDNCDKLTEIITDSDEKIEGEAQICLNKLQILTLSELGSITSFCSQNNLTLKFPLLVDLVVKDCPQMEFFSSGYLSAPKLKTVWLTWNEDSSFWKGDLNTTIYQLHTDKRLVEEQTNAIEWCAESKVEAARNEEEEEAFDLGNFFGL